MRAVDVNNLPVQRFAEVSEVRVMLLNHAAQLIHPRILRGVLLTQLLVQIRASVGHMLLQVVSALVLCRVLH